MEADVNRPHYGGSMRYEREVEDWRDILKKEVEAGRELCHADCGEPAKVLRLYGKKIGAWCRGCASEIFHGSIPRLDPPRGIKRGPNRKKLMD